MQPIATVQCCTCDRIVPADEALRLSTGDYACYDCELPFRAAVEASDAPAAVKAWALAEGGPTPSPSFGRPVTSDLRVPYPYQGRGIPAWRVRWWYTISHAHRLVRTLHAERVESGAYRSFYRRRIRPARRISCSFVRQLQHGTTCWRTKRALLSGWW